MIQIITMLGGVRAAICAGVAVLLLAALGVQTWRLHSAQASEARLQVRITEWRSAQTTNLGTIEALRARLVTLAAERAHERQRQADAVAQAQADATARQRDLQSRIRQLERLYASDPDTARWADDGLPAGVLRKLPDPD